MGPENMYLSGGGDPGKGGLAACTERENRDPKWGGGEGRYTTRRAASAQGSRHGVGSSQTQHRGSKGEGITRAESRGGGITYQNAAASSQPKLSKTMEAKKKNWAPKGLQTARITRASDKSASTPRRCRKKKARKSKIGKSGKGWAGTGPFLKENRGVSGTKKRTRNPTLNSYCKNDCNGKTGIRKGRIVLWWSQRRGVAAGIKPSVKVERLGQNLNQE